MKKGRSMVCGRFFLPMDVWKRQENTAGEMIIEEEYK